MSIVAAAIGATDDITNIASMESESAASEGRNKYKNGSSLTRKKKNAVGALLVQSLLLGLLIGIISGGVYFLTAVISTGKVEWRNIMAGIVGSAFLTAALTFSINFVRL